MQTTVLSWEEALRQLSPGWSALVARTGMNPSLDPRWLAASLSSHSLPGTIHVAALLEGDELIGALPFRCHTVQMHGIPLNAVDVCSNVVSYHADLTATRGHERLLKDALDFAHRGKWDVLHFANATDDGAVPGALAALTDRHAWTVIDEVGESSPYVRIESSWDDFLKTRSKKLRANITRSVRRMKECGETAMLWFDGTADSAPLLDYIMEIEKRSWKFDAGTAILPGNTEGEYHRRLLPALVEMDALFANVLMVHDKPAAYVLGCRHNGWIGQLKTSFDSSLQDAGSRVIDESLRKAFEVSAQIYDFLGAATPHKLKWTDNVRSHRNYWIYSSRVRARLVATAKRFARRMRRPAAENATESPAPAEG
jgi:CelD/BcsL family acetyltransferase involved in cellulose biosynthesis